MDDGKTGSAIDSMVIARIAGGLYRHTFASSDRLLMFDVSFDVPLNRGMYRGPGW